MTKAGKQAEKADAQPLSISKADAIALSISASGVLAVINSLFTYMRSPTKTFNLLQATLLAGGVATIFGGVFLHKEHQELEELKQNSPSHASAAIVDMTNKETTRGAETPQI